MTGENIVCFAKDWDDDPTSNTHVMRVLARRNRVLWLNSIGMRSPSANSTDVRRIARKIGEFRRGAEQILPNLWVATPLVLPLPHSPLAVRANRSMLALTVGRFRRKICMESFQLWTFLPNTVSYVGHLGESLLVYYCTDDWRHVPGMDGVRLAAQEAALSRRADIVFATSRSLVERQREVNGETHLASHGVDHVHFARALDPGPIAPELQHLPAPVIGVIGLIDDRIDMRLVAMVAGRHPEWTIALIGRVTGSTREIEALPNVRLIGRQPYERLPEFCRGLAVGLIPFRTNEFTRHINPVKLREYLGAGLPVVSTDLPEVRSYGALCRVARDGNEFVAAIEAALREDGPALRQARSDAVRAESWETSVATLVDHVARLRSPARMSAC